MYKKQADRKKRKNFVPELFERYFRRNEGTTDYATVHSVVLGGVFDISIDSYPSSTSSQHMLFGNNVNSSFLEVNSLGRVRFRALGVADVVSADGIINLNIFQTIRITSAANQIEIFVDGVSVATMAGTPTAGVYVERLYARGDGNNFSGILANLKIWDNGTLIRDYPLDDNSDDLRELASGQNGTVINGNASDWGLFQQQATGEWLGQELSLISSTGLLGDDSDPEFAVVAFTADIGTGITYRAGAVFDTYAGTSDAGFTSISSGMPAAPPFRATLASTGDFIGGEWVTTASGGVSLFGRAASVSSFSSITLKEVLNVA